MRSCSSFALAAAIVFGGLSTASAKPMASVNLNTCGVNDVTFRLAASQACFGEYTSSNDDLALLNSLPVFGGGWETMVRDNGTEGSALYNGVNWTLRADNTQTSGNWQLLLQDPAPANLPMSIDFMVVLKGSNSWSAYQFNGQKFYPTDLTNNGTFAISIVNGGNQTPGLSHMSLYFSQRHDLRLLADRSEVRRAGSQLRGRRLPQGHRAGANVDGAARPGPARRGRRGSP